MTQVENAKNKMYKSVLSFLTATLASFAGFGRLLDEIANFKALNGTLDGFIQEQGQVIKGITKDKVTVFAGLVKNVVAAARKGLVFAKDQGDEELKALLDVRASVLNEMSATEALARIKNIYGALNDNGAALAAYMVLAGDIAAIGSGIMAFAGAQPAPRNARSMRAAARKSMVATMKSIDASLDIIDDLLLNTYGESDSEMVEKYMANRAIKNNEVRHTGVRSRLTDAATGEMLQGAWMAIEALKKRGVADIEGLAQIVKMKPGTFHVSFGVEGYETVTMTLKIVRGRIGMVEVGLKRVG